MDYSSTNQGRSRYNLTVPSTQLYPAPLDAAEPVCLPRTLHVLLRHQSTGQMPHAEVAFLVRGGTILRVAGDDLFGLRGLRGSFGFLPGRTGVLLGLFSEHERRSAKRRGL